MIILSRGVRVRVCIAFILYLICSGILNWLLSVCLVVITVFVWSGAGSEQASDPFYTAPDDDPMPARRLMRFLCLVADWEQENLAESLFSGM